MSVEQYQRELNKLDEEISKLSTKQANIESEISKLEGKIISSSYTFFLSSAK